MSRTLWITRLWQPSKKSRRKQRGTLLRGKRIRPRLEALEDRTLLSAPVSNTTDLIAAINNANAAGGATTITLASGTTFDFASADNNTNGANALPVIMGNITIVGNGDTLDGSKVVRLFDVASGGSLTLENLTLTGGLAQATDAGAEGGAVYSSGTLTLSVSTLSGNAACNGGGIFNLGNLTVSNSTLSGNTVVQNSSLLDNGGWGGSIANVASLTLSDSTLSGNTAAGGGGGILNYSSGSLTLSDSTLSGNSSSNGGGVYNSGSMTVSDSTLSGNSGGTGGGIYNAQGSAILSNATVADNIGVGVFAGGNVMLHNTLVARNLSGGNPSDVTFGNLNSTSDYNLIGDGSGGLSTANHNLLGSATNLLDPLLAPLGNYGGPTQTMALLPGSPAIDAGSSAYGGSTDQRGEPRVGATDIGAFESQGFSIAVSSGNNQSAAVNTAFARPLVVSVTANNSVEPVAGGTVTFTAPASGASAVLSGSPAVIGSLGKASVTATANGTSGSYNVTANAAGAISSATFTLTNQSTQAANLIVNGDFESGNTGFTTGYTYSPGNIAPEGTYDILTNPHNSHPGGESYGDHTTGQGLMMALNGATSYPTTVWQETVSVQPNTNYQFSGWVSNWSADRDTNLPDLNFNFNSVLVGQFNVPPNEPIGQWDNVTFTWDSGNNSTLNLSIIDTQTAAYGNDFALDDLSLTAPNAVPQPTLSVSDAGGTYNGNPFPATATAVGVDGKTPVSGSFSYAYYAGSSASGTPSTTAPSTAGTYTVVATFTSSDPNYASGGTGQTTFTIQPATSTPVTIDFDDLQGMSFWAGTPVPSWALLTNQYASLGVIFQRTVVCDGGLGHAVTGTNFIAGITPTGTVTYSSHYPQIEFSFFVGRTPATTDFVSIRGDLEGGNGQSQTLYAYDLAGNLVGSSTEMDTGGQTYSIQAAGIHTIKWSGVDIDDQPPVSQVGGVGLDHLVFDPVVAISQPTLSVSDAGGTYNGHAFAATAKVVGVDGKTAVNGSFSYAYYVGSSASGTPSATAPANAGTYTVVATFTSSDPNYASGGTAKTTFTIKPATPTLSVTDAGGTYNGSAFPATAKALGVDGKTAVNGSFSYAYYVGSSASGAALKTAPTTAGTYTVVATFTSSNPNYSNGTARSTFIIAKATTASSNPTVPPQPSTMPMPILAQMVLDVESLPFWGNAQKLAVLETMLWIGYSTASAQSPQLAGDLIWAEMGLTWDLILAGNQPLLLVNNPHSIALANAIDQNPLYHTPPGWLMAYALAEQLLIV